ncbi:MAG: hypothetical protein ACLGXA_12135 [Acidobacteriota bacterium]
MRSVVLIHGLLDGMGRQEPCEMLALRDCTAPNQVVYSSCSVIEAPLSLPDGDYTVTFGSYTVPAHKQSGLWLPEGTPADAPPLASQQTDRSRTTRPTQDGADGLRVLHNRVA